MENLEKKPNPLKREHLKEGVSPIISCVCDRNNLDEQTQYYLDAFKKDAEFVNFYSKKEELYEKNFKNSGKETYVISEISGKNKYSLEYFDCTGIVAVGISSKTGENISFLSHQNPGFFVENKEEKLKFKSHLIESINKLKEQCVPGTVDIVIFGGQKEKVKLDIINDNFVLGRDDLEEVPLIRKEFDVYKDSIRYLNFFISNEMGFSPVVISGPNDNFEEEYHPLGIYFDNKNRRLYLVKPKQDSVNNESFLAEEGERQIKKIENKNKDAKK